jgi:adenosylmethionine-8-amino-7-oxononanoate aminotransferase
LACSAALATLAIIEADNVIESNQAKSAYLGSQMRVLANLPIEHIRQQGMILAFDVKNKNAKFSRDCYSAALKQGLLLRPIGNTVYFMPPYTITEPEMDLMMQATLLAIQDSL